MRLVLGLVGVLTALVGSAYLYERFVRRSPLRFPYLTSRLSDARYAELAAQGGWSKEALQVVPGITLNGLVFRPQASNAKWVLFFSGNDANMLTRSQNVLRSLAQGQDYGLATFAYRGYDSSGGTPRVDDMAEDAAKILEHVTGLPGVKRERLHVVGFSIGGYLAASAVEAASRAGRPTASLSLMASVHDIVMMRASPLQKFSLGDAWRIEPHLAQVPAPVLVLQGGADEALQGERQGKAIAQALGGKASYQAFAGVGHEALLEHEPALQAVRQFIAQH